MTATLDTLIDLLLRHCRGESVSFAGTLPWDIDALIAELARRNLLDAFVDPPWDGSDRGLYLEKTATGYLLFVADRGMRNWQENFTGLREAIHRKLVLTAEAFA